VYVAVPTVVGATQHRKQAWEDLNQQVLGTAIEQRWIEIAFRESVF
jgi:hypothetical protein